MSRTVGWLILALVIVTCVAVGFGAYRLADHSWNAVVGYTSPYLQPALPETAETSAVARTTVFVIVDGLRLDASRRMKSMRALRTHGHDAAATAPQPSLSYPNWTTLLSGAPPFMSGVVTNWHEGAAPVETIFDTARRAGVRTVFVGPKDFDALYGVGEKCDRTFMLEWDERYLSGRYVDAALRISKEETANLIVVHLPDVDEAGHAHGGGSAEYRRTVERVDADLGRLINGLQSDHTVFVIAADHGHIDTGGHGGWEPEVTSVPVVFAGPGVFLGEGTARLEDVASSVALLAGIPVPRDSVGTPLRALAGERTALGTATLNRAPASVRRLRVVQGTALDGTGGEFGSGAMRLDEAIRRAEETRAKKERQARAPYFWVSLVVMVIAFVAAGLTSWRALLAAVCGTVTYYTAYNFLFFVVHRYRWSLSAFNSEDKIGAWMNMRLVEAAVAGVVAAIVAAAVYPLLRQRPKGPQHGYAAGWLILGPLTILMTLLTLGVQVGWFVWQWGVEPVWRLPDLLWGFKYDLDLIQATSLGFVAVVTPLVTFLIGRYHPRVRASSVEE